MLGTPKGCVRLHRRQLLRNNTPRIPTAQLIKLLVVMDAYAEGALVKGGSRLASVTDGTSNTVFFGEDIGRDSWMQVNHVYLDPLDNEKRRFWRWAEADNAFGISKKINNNNSPQGGPADCPWTTNNCGPFEEIFSQHPGGAQVLLGDGSVRLLTESLDPATLRSLVTRSGDEVIGEF